LNLIMLRFDDSVKTQHDLSPAGSPSGRAFAFKRLTDQTEKPRSSETRSFEKRDRSPWPPPECCHLKT
jgi:hypothetical protein